ncbi:hypothetical protein T4D_16623 [Trichinella pseudospiralis]|uniref:Uncharacterized protein n=1 Tax=Trichinella pseudospiralis TaxID=6337 RepID=A0A0V1F9P5_TRIPS|nr:hypothetical protein T4D_16623 [Trichinella pseudospiralis]
MANEMPIWALIIHVRCFTMNNSKSNLYPQDLLSDVKVISHVHFTTSYNHDQPLLGRLLHNRFDYSSNISSSSSSSRRRRRRSSSNSSSWMIDSFPLNMQQRADGKRNFSELSNG